MPRQGQWLRNRGVGVVSAQMMEMLCDSPSKRDLLQAGGGYAMIFGPGRLAAGYTTATH